jgi:thioredoxin reductase
LDEQGNVKTDQMQKTNVKGLYAAGDVKGSMGAVAAVCDGGIAAVSIVHEWYD